MLFIGETYRLSAGPYWLGMNLDPDYAYLMNSLALADGKKVGHSDHPGATLQVLGALAVRGAHVFSGKQPLVEDALRRPESYLLAIHWLVLVLVAAAAFATGALVLKTGGSLPLAMLAQWGPLTAEIARSSLGRVWPEPLLMALTMLLGALAWRACALAGRSRLAAIAGIVFGLGVALKITFIPLFFLPVTAFRRLREWVLYLVCIGVVLGAYALNPLMDPRGFLRFGDDLVARAGYARPVDPDTQGIDATTAGAGRLIRSLAAQDAVALAGMALVLSVGALLIVPRIRKRLQVPPDAMRVWVGLGIALVGQVALASNGPGGYPRYLVPAFGLIGFGLALVVQALHRVPAARWAAVAAIGLIGLAAAAATVGGIRATARNMTQWSDCHAAAEALSGDVPVLCYYRSSSLPSALYFGNQYARYHFSSQLAALYPDYYHVNRWAGTVHAGFLRVSTGIAKVLRKFPSLMFQGAKSIHPRELVGSLPPGYVWTTVYESPVEHLVLLHPLEAQREEARAGTPQGAASPDRARATPAD